MSTVIELPWPPSVNSMYRSVSGRMLLSRKGRAYKADVAALVAVYNANKGYTGRLQMIIEAQPPDRRRRDLDNLIKGIQDALESAGVYLDDSQIDWLQISRLTPIKGGKVVVKVSEIIE